MPRIKLKKAKKQILTLVNRIIFHQQIQFNKILLWKMRMTIGSKILLTTTVILSNKMMIQMNILQHQLIKMLTVHHVNHLIVQARMDLCFKIIKIMRVFIILIQLIIVNN